MKRHLALGAALLAIPVTTAAQNNPHDASAAAYEHLATAIIEINATEDALVEGILNHHFAMAEQQLRAAVAEKKVGDHAKAAADEITSIANEGNKRVQAVRQKLLQSGHHHHTDAETEEDYIWIDSSEKKTLLDLAGAVAKATDVATVKKQMEELSTVFAAAMKPE